MLTALLSSRALSRRRGGAVGVFKPPCPGGYDPQVTKQKVKTTSMPRSASAERSWTGINIVANDWHPTGLRTKICCQRWSLNDQHTKIVWSDRDSIAALLCISTP
jgi:hypothetical protein